MIKHAVPTSLKEEMNLGAIVCTWEGLGFIYTFQMSQVPLFSMITFGHHSTADRFIIIVYLCILAHLVEQYRRCHVGTYCPIWWIDNLEYSSVYIQHLVIVWFYWSRLLMNSLGSSSVDKNSAASVHSYLPVLHRILTYTMVQHKQNGTLYNIP